jgi:hypothetical protein
VAEITYTSAAAISMLAQSSGSVWVVLLEFDFGGTPIRVCKNNADILSNSALYSHYDFQISMLTQSPDEDPVLRASFENVSRTTIDDGSGGKTGLIYWLNQMTLRTKVTIRVVLAEEPDDDQIEPVDVYMYGFNWTRDMIHATMSKWNFMHEEYPGSEFTPYYTPGLFTEPTSGLTRDESMKAGFVADDADALRR